MELQYTLEKLEYKRFSGRFSKLYLVKKDPKSGPIVELFGFSNSESM